MNHFLNHPIVNAVGWALLHFVWQGALLAAPLLAVNAVTRPSQAKLRYAIACIVMLLMPVLFVATIFRGGPSPAAAAEVETGTPMQTAQAGVSVTEVPANPVWNAQTSRMWNAELLTGWAVFLWLTGIAALATYTLVGWGRARRLTRQGFEPATPALAEMLDSLQRRLSISQPVQLCISAIAEVPAVIGWIRPYVLLPVSTITGLSESELRAILAHELAHIRRHDYVVNLVQNAVETLLFYHPAVWWVSNCVRKEREHCCDDIAVTVCGDAMLYASALTQLEEVRGRICEPALAATGGDLLGRIRRLAGYREKRDRIAGSALAVIAVTLILGLTIGAAQSQTPAAPPLRKFDVASIRPAGPYTGGLAGGVQTEGRRLLASHVGLNDLIGFAWDVNDFQISGGPEWKNGGMLDGPNRFRVEARVEGGEIPTKNQMRLMLRSLLADRFQLKVTITMKPWPAWDLVVDNGGPKLKPSAPDAVTSLILNAGKSPRMSITATAVTIESLIGAGWMRHSSGRPVVDKTGLTGKYDFVLQWTAEIANPDIELPDFATALRSQMGLRLQSAQAPLDAVVIDHAERPTEN